MSQNESGLDRIVRVVFGLALLSLVFIGPHTWFGLVGLIPLITGIVGYCPIYGILGISTCSVQRLGGHGPAAGSR